VIGFSRPSILTSFVFESLLLSFLGALVGIVPDAAVQRDDHWNLERGDVQRGRVQLTNDPTGGGASHHLWPGMGLIGGFAPAWHAARQNILAALPRIGSNLGDVLNVRNVRACERGGAFASLEDAKFIL